MPAHPPISDLNYLMYDASRFHYFMYDQSHELGTLYSDMYIPRNSVSYTIMDMDRMAENVWVPEWSHFILNLIDCEPEHHRKLMVAINNIQYNQYICIDGIHSITGYHMECDIENCIPFSQNRSMPADAPCLHDFLSEVVHGGM